MFSLQGRVALVTGAGRGIGRGIAVGLAAQGAKIACAARTRSQLDEAVAAIREAGGEGLAFELDMGDMDSLDRVVAAVLEEFGQIDILVNNAGMNIRQPIEEVSEENFDQIMAVNFKGLYFLSQKVARHMVERKQGKIINIGSLTTGYALAKVSVYGATKGAVGQITRAQAVEFGPHNIQVNAICPGPVEGERMRNVIEHRARQLGKAPEVVRREYLESAALGRMVSPEDVAATVAFLASPEGDSITGQAVDVSAGYGL